jgi:hypothetical protein
MQNLIGRLLIMELLPVSITGIQLPIRTIMKNNEIKVDIMFSLSLLHFEDIITTEEHDRLIDMFRSKDNENHVLAILAIESFKKRAHEKRK